MRLCIQHLNVDQLNETFEQHNTVEFITLLSKSLSLAETELVLIITTGTVFSADKASSSLLLNDVSCLSSQTLFFPVSFNINSAAATLLLLLLLYFNLAMDYGIILIKIYRILEARIIKFKVLLIISDSTRDRFEFHRSSNSSRTNSKIQKSQLIRKTANTSDTHRKSRSRLTRIPCWFHLFSS